MATDTSPWRKADPSDALRRKIRDWLLAFLRFSLTLEPADKAATLAIADEMDRLGFVSKSPGFSFFLRTSTDLCNALAHWDQAGRADILRQHLARIDDPRMRRAFLAAFDLESAEVAPATRDRIAALLRPVPGKVRSRAASINKQSNV